MTLAKFTETENIKGILERIEPLKTKRFSDTFDADGHQYVDLVQEGGGVLGIALIGYTYVLESAGIRFFSLAGTSAGAINTLMLASLGKINETKSEKVLTILSEKNLFDLVDGDKSIKKLIQKAIKKENGWALSLVWNALKIYRILKSKFGLNPGNDFENWITEILKKEKIFTLKDLEDLRQIVPALHDETGQPLEAKPRLAIITSDISTCTKVEFPKMKSLYWKNPDQENPAKLVRASMSIPYFFEPYEVSDLPNAGQAHDPKWDEFARYTGKVPEKVKFVDGGMLSNFPINVFHRSDHKLPKRPTFGARLSAYRDEASDTSSFLKMSGAMISTMRQIHDYDFLLKNPDYKKLICRIDADQDFNWLDFNMTEEDKIKLFERGATKAIEFLETFDWEDYKKQRAKEQN
ncbi:patatin-like phospholipase family protein [Marivirga sp.]|uniref:patatin-like phospholipase family protein n=1 Tax=Marivirga sp. TaxID=2018662 RepID=UPI003DA773EE